MIEKIESDGLLFRNKKSKVPFYLCKDNIFLFNKTKLTLIFFPNP